MDEKVLSQQKGRDVLCAEALNSALGRGVLKDEHPGRSAPELIPDGRLTLL